MQRTASEPTAFSPRSPPSARANLKPTGLQAFRGSVRAERRSERTACPPILMLSKYHLSAVRFKFGPSKRTKDWHSGISYAVRNLLMSWCTFFQELERSWCTWPCHDSHIFVNNNIKHNKRKRWWNDVWCTCSCSSVPVLVPMSSCPPTSTLELVVQYLQGDNGMGRNTRANQCQLRCSCTGRRQFPQVWLAWLVFTLSEQFAESQNSPCEEPQRPPVNNSIPQLTETTDQ